MTGFALAILVWTSALLACIAAYASGYARGKRSGNRRTHQEAATNYVRGYNDGYRENAIVEYNSHRTAPRHMTICKN